MADILWQPSQERIQSANISAFMRKVNKSYNLSLQDFDSLYDWSIANLENFWSVMWDFLSLDGEKGEGPYLRYGERFQDAVFFENTKLNFAQNLLKSRDGDGVAVVYWTEEGHKEHLSYTQLCSQVSSVQQYMRAKGVKVGDRIAALMPNCPQTLVIMLAAASLGAIFSSTSPDFGISGVLDRFGQIEPKLLFAVDGVLYGGKKRMILNKVKAVSEALQSLKQVVLWPQINKAYCPQDEQMLWGQILKDYPAKKLDFRPMPFNAPVYIMFSSGTTGAPKCIIHRAGGVLLKQLAELSLHCDIKEGDRVFYYSTCGWMMWNWMVAALALNATLVLFDGSPFHPTPAVLWDMAEKERLTFFGASAKYLDALAGEGFESKEHDLTTLRTITSTGSPLMHEGYDYVYQKIKQDVCLSSISGGTDIMGCFMGGNPIGPVIRGEIQKRCLGTATAVYNEKGEFVTGEKGELVCTKPFPSIPLGFWGDEEGLRFHKAYFDKFPEVWTHGDYVELMDNGGMIVYGRSDATLNPGGVRIGTAEIYRQVESFKQIAEAIVVGQAWGSDSRIILFVKLNKGYDLSHNLVAALRKKIREGASPRHVPAKIIEVADIPRTKSGKIVELAVRDVIHGREVKNLNALANPEALAFYRNLAPLNTESKSDAQRSVNQLQTFSEIQSSLPGVNSFKVAPHPKDATESMLPEAREAMLFEALPAFIRLAKRHSPFWEKRLRELNGDTFSSRVGLATLPKLTLEEIVAAQKETPPHGGLSTALTESLIAMGKTREGFVYAAGQGDWGACTPALQAAGFTKNDVTLLAFDSRDQGLSLIAQGGLEKISGCKLLVPSTEPSLLLEWVQHFGPTAIIMRQSPFLDFLNYIRKHGKCLECLGRSLVFSDSSSFIKEEDLKAVPHLDLCLALASEPCGVIAYQPLGESAFVLSQYLIAEFVDPVSDQPVVHGDMGELLITRLDKYAPIFRFSTKILTRELQQYSPSKRTGVKLLGFSA